MIELPADACITNFLREADRLGVGVRWKKEMINLDAAYVARPGQPGEILLHDQSPRPSNPELCTLLAHEMVPQHWKGNLKATPLGWPGNTTRAHLSLQQREAYTAQEDLRK